MIGTDLTGPVAALAIATRAFAPFTFVDLLVTLLTGKCTHFPASVMLHVRIRLKENFSNSAVGFTFPINAMIAQKC
jgi:hypothetical protein